MANPDLWSLAVILLQPPTVPMAAYGYAQENSISNKAISAPV